ncbi:MAG: amino acid ABC transporter ATP-binding protein [Rhodoferax sp.]|nr:amino acid ABC transporter ATP-binding protein [Rhodoferax sp.]OIP22324.1 MAG: glutamine ABC transporter ATP-binding protein [Comamonadaceae bacterium CG2_30_60_41]PIW09076.1 MAG: glutamine ABC transporter ATP-binding protein [Comamonadaceae bacterium CG17_big_fil_post_rev_8_21_14_2_50_60_13]PIY25610.1 MAG: glutamine ABC transporter ATP-binding protein [Comamonadaceae bacterium CG_4_10_14_3_um_filter_60_75]PJC16009.1 MAG: glutamine ABC transporter ATP-binding protein [Comamonadaceae bacteriu
MQLEFCGICKQFGARPVLRDISLKVPEFQSLAIVGPSGGGKTTLLRTIAGLEKPDSGRLRIGQDWLAFTEQALLAHRRSIGTVFQGYNLFPHLTALENVMLPLVKVHGVARGQARDTADALFKRFQLLAHAHQRPAELSGGQQQRVAIVRAIAIEPRFLIFDEPTSALDPEMTAEVLDCIAELRAEGRPLIIVTHNMGFAREVSDRCLFIAEGQILEEGRSAELFSAPQHPLMVNFLAKVLRY